MSSLLRRSSRRGPRRPRRVRVRTGIIVASGVVALVGGLVLSRIDTAQWWNDGTGEAAGSDQDLRMLVAEGESEAERVVSELSKWARPTGWKRGKATGSVGDPFGLTCLDGPVAWANGLSRTLTADGADGALTVLAYPAGGGGAAVAQVADAASRCADSTEETEHGVDGLRYAKGKSAVTLVRRGDVVAVVTSAPAAKLPGEEWLTALDDRLTRLLEGACRQLGAPAEDATRNPFIDPEAFTGNVVRELVPLPPVDLTRAEEVATDPVVPLDSVAPPIVDAGERPQALDPAAPDVDPLPAEVQKPVAPVAPVAPDLNGQAGRAVADPVGPGCGWKFTGQAVPQFDEGAATRAYEQAVKEERKRLVDDAVAHEQGKVNFYRAWANFLVSVNDYATYAQDLAGVREQWQVVIDARATFVAAYEAYRASQQAYDDFVVRQEAARVAFDQQQLRCLDLSLWLDPANGCPAVRPTILDEVAPTVLPVPVPDPAAQLPAGWTPPETPQTRAPSDDAED